MDFIHLTDTIIVSIDGQTHTITSSDSRYDNLLKLIKSENYTDEEFKDLVFLKLGKSVKNAEIKDGQFLINGEIVPEPFRSFLLKKQNNPQEFEFFYNLYFSLAKRNDTHTLNIFSLFITTNPSYTLYIKEGQSYIIYHGLNTFGPNNIFYKLKGEKFNKESISSFMKKYFSKNVYKQLENFIFNPEKGEAYFPDFALKFLVNFKTNDDKFFQEIKDYFNVSSYYFLENEASRNELISCLKLKFKINSISKLKKFFNGIPLSEGLNELHVLLSRIKNFANLYVQEVFFDDYSKLTFQDYYKVVSLKIKEWEQRFKDLEQFLYFNLESKHPFLLNLKPFSTHSFGECFFILPQRGMDLDSWSNTMNHCIRTYKKTLIQSESMILISVVNKQREMIATLELSVQKYTTGLMNLEFRQFVGFGNEAFNSICPNTGAQIVDELNEAFNQYYKQ